MILPCRCGALRSSMLSQRYILQIHLAMWVCDVINMRCYHYWSRGWLYFVRYMVLCFVEVVSGGYAMGRQCGLSQFYQVCPCFFFNLLLSQMYDFTSMISPCRCGALRSLILRQRYILQIQQLRWPCNVILKEMKIHSSCEIEDFVETHLCKLCVILRLCVLRVVCPH